MPYKIIMVSITQHGTEAYELTDMLGGVERCFLVVDSFRWVETGPACTVRVPVTLGDVCKPAKAAVVHPHA
jgi:hypothetical protein